MLEALSPHSSYGPLAPKNPRLRWGCPRPLKVAKLRKLLAPTLLRPLLSSEGLPQGWLALGPTATDPLALAPEKRKKKPLEKNMKQLLGDKFSQQGGLLPRPAAAGTLMALPRKTWKQKTQKKKKSGGLVLTLCCGGGYPPPSYRPQDSYGLWPPKIEKGIKHTRG